MVSTTPRTSLNINNSGCQYLPNIPELLDSTNAPSPNQQLMPLTGTAKDDRLSIGGCDVGELVQQFGSPLYILDEITLRTACQQYREAFQKYYPGESLVIYASKAWSCVAVAAIVRSEGLGIDVVSGAELFTALQAGISPEKIYFHGNNKSLIELEEAIACGCTLMVDNWLELETLGKIATQPVKIMLRLTPGIECHTHEYIRTGHLDSKFGFDPTHLDRVFTFVREHPLLKCLGIHAHIGSQIFEQQPHQDLAGVMVEFLTKANQYGITVEQLNIGGGLGVCYTESDDPPSIDAWVQGVCESLVKACAAKNLPLPKVISEPGRSLIAPACVTAYTIGSTKTVPGIRTYIAIDGGMSDNPRPITYQSVYRAVVANKMTQPLTETVTVAGKHCESGDILIKTAQLPPTIPGDILVVLTTGAYNYSMASNYNRIPRPAAVLVKDGRAELILQRETYQDLLRQDLLPPSLKPDLNQEN